MQGRLFIHTSKGLRLANITFDSSPEIDHVKRLSCPSNKQKRRTDFCPSKATTSPVKENQETETEEDGLEKNKRKAKSFVKSPKKKKSSKSPLEKSKTEKGTESADGRTAEDKLNETIDSVVNSYESDEASAKEDEKPVSSNEEDPNGSTDPENGLKPIEVAEWDCNTSMESVDIKHSPEHSADSGSGMLSCKEVTMVMSCFQNFVRNPHKITSIRNMKNRPKILEVCRIHRHTVITVIAIRLIRLFRGQEMRIK